MTPSSTALLAPMSLSDEIVSTAISAGRMNRSLALAEMRADVDARYGADEH